MKQRIKQPFSYYGGKAMMAGKIVAMMPEHVTYTETFCGGASIFWSKEPSKLEVLNDLNREVVNFYIQVKLNFKELNKLVQGSLHSRDLHRDAWVMYNNPHLFDAVQRAWALWMLTNMGFSSQIGSSFGVSVTGDLQPKKVANKRDAFGPHLAERLSKVTVESKDAVEVITQYDHAKAFHYCDPPYFNSDCGHYDGYTEQDFVRLLEGLAAVKGKFLLSSYPSDVLAKYVNKYGWKQDRTESLVTVALSKTNRKKKVEVLTWNY